MKVRTQIQSGSACYTVVTGDTLSKISLFYYGSDSAENVQKIYYSNMKTIGPNPNVLSPGQRLYLPD